MRIPAREERTIIINTMPLAPSRAVAGKKINCTSPDTKAVSTMQPSSRLLPYFSSRGGPTTRKSIILLIK